MRKGLSLGSVLSAALLLGTLTAAAVRAQNAKPAPRKIQVTEMDTSASEQAAIVHQHVHPAMTTAGSAFKHSQFATPEQRANAASHAGPKFSGSGGNDQLRFPADLSYLGGPVVPLAQSHPIFLLPNGSCPVATCWGDPETFLNDYGISGLSHITDQYVGSFANDRYTLGDEFALPYTPPPVPLTNNDILAIVHAAASFSGETGYDHIYHVFLPPGQDECFTSSPNSACYSPDNPSRFAFCAYHGSVTFSDIGHVLFTVEPFQNVEGCAVRPDTPNGQLIDSTNSTLSHELTETITDPDGDAWFNFTLNVLAGEEIGDECAFFVVQQTSPTTFAAFGDPTVFKVGKHKFATQPEYSNEDHGCGVAP
jgi:hypothetical protein